MKLRYQLLVFIAIRTVLNAMIRMVYPFLPVFARGLGVDLWLVSLALTLRSGAGAAGPFLASLADSRGRKAGMLLGLLIFTAGAAIMALWPGYPAFVAALVLTLVGNFVFAPSLQAYLGDRVAYSRRGRALALVEFGWSLSFLAGMPVIGFLIARLGWQAPFPFLAGLGLLSVVVLAWILPRDPAPEPGHPSLGRKFLAVYTFRPALAGLLLGLLMCAANELFNVVMGVWMEDSFGLQVAALGGAAALIGVAELGGEALVSGWSDRLGKMRSVGGGLALNCLAVLALAFAGARLPLALAGLFLFYLTFEFAIVSSVPLMTEILPAARATLMANYVAGMAAGRGLSDLVAAPLYRLGEAVPGALPPLLWVALGVVVCNAAAALALFHIRPGVKAPRPILQDEEEYSSPH